MTKRRLRRLPRHIGATVQASTVLMMVSAVPAFPQEQEPSNVTVLPTLVLEGTKVAREFTETTASVGVLDSETIERQGGTDLRESFGLFGNVRYFGGGSGNAGFVVRGLSAEGVTESSNSAPLTSVIVDGTTQTIETMRRGARGLWDVEQVEIFRGPQSTLQGRGALAGAVIVETKDPTFFFESDFRGIVGGLDRREAAFAVSGPLIDGVLAARLSGEYRLRDRGITFNQPENEIFGEDEYRNLRGKLLFTPPSIPELSFLLTVSDTYDRPGLSVSNSADFFDREYNTGTNSPVEAREADNLNVSLETSYDLGGGVELTSLSSFLDAKTRIFTPEGNTYSRDAAWTDKNFTQDLRLTFGGEDDATLTGVVGLFYGRFTQPRGDLMTAGSNIIQQISADNRTTSVSAYADATWRFAPDWSLIAGGRLTHERVSNRMEFCGIIFSVLCPANSPMGEIKDLDASTSDTVFLPKLGLTHHFSDFQTLSATVQRGYRSGFVAIQDPVGPTQVKPEYMTSYELAWRLEDPARFWRIGATAFYSRYNDQQVVIGKPYPDLPRTENAGESEIYGAEVEGSYAFDNGLSLFGSLGLLRTKFLDFEASGGNLRGNHFPESPQITAGLGVSYQHDSGFFGSLTASYTGSYYSTGSVENDPALKVANFTHVNARLGYQKDNWEIVAYVDNLFDSDYVTSLSSPAAGAPPSEAVVSEPRNIGVELRARF